MKSYILTIAMSATLAVSAVSASAGIDDYSDIKEFLEAGEPVTIGDSIKGKMRSFATSGEMTCIHVDSVPLPKELKIILQDNDSIWFENPFPVTDSATHRAWLKGLYIGSGKYYNKETKKTELREMITVVPHIPLGHVEKIIGDDRYSWTLFLSNGVRMGPRNPRCQNEYGFHIKFLTGEDMSLTCTSTFSSQRYYYQVYYNDAVECPYGIYIDKLPYTIYDLVQDEEVIVSNLKLTPIEK